MGGREKERGKREGERKREEGGGGGGEREREDRREGEGKREGGREGEGERERERGRRKEGRREGEGEREREEEGGGREGEREPLRVCASKGEQTPIIYDLWSHVLLHFKCCQCVICLYTATVHLNSLLHVTHTIFNTTTLYNS